MDKLLKMIPRGTFATVGGALGGAPGRLVGDALSKISGYGSYTVNHNSLHKSTIYNDEGVPSFTSIGHGNRIRHREFITDVIAPPNPNDYVVNGLRISPENASLFPWFSKLASRYQKYKVHGMVFYYRSTSTDYQNSGTVALAVNYNATEGVYTSSESMLNAMFAVSSKPSLSFAAPVECDPASSPDGGYYVRHPSNITGVTDLRLSTVGVLNLATYGLTVDPGTVVGQLWCTYDIELLYPYVNPSLSESERMHGTWYAQVTSVVGSDVSEPVLGTGGNFQIVTKNSSGDLKGTSTLTWADLDPTLLGKEFRINISTQSQGADALTQTSHVPVVVGADETFRQEVIATGGSGGDNAETSGTMKMAFKPTQAAGSISLDVRQFKTSAWSAFKSLSMTQLTD
jgi:hypothetical protein